MDNINIKTLINIYINNEISFNGVIKEYVNTRTLEITDKDVSHSVLICKPNIIFKKIDMPSHGEF